MPCWQLPESAIAQRQLTCHYACYAVAITLQCAVMLYTDIQLIQEATHDCMYLTQQEDME